MEEYKNDTGMRESHIVKLAKMPQIENQIRKSEDGKWVIHKTIITDIKSIKYYEKMFDIVKSSNGKKKIKK
tara:strand:+ start:503 stop:715 length:213 start_codon:yes stop_codon:yes gene_type:complete